MPIRVRIERVGYYKQFPDKVIYDFEIERTDELDVNGLRKYLIGDLEVWHPNGAGVETLATKALETVKGFKL